MSPVLAENAAAQGRLMIFKRVWPQDSSEVGTARLRSGILFASTELMHRPRFKVDFPLHFDIGTWTYSKFVRKNKVLALSVCLPQPCPGAGRRFAVSRSCLSHWWFVSTKTSSMKCFVNWIPINTHVHFIRTQAYLQPKTKNQKPKFSLPSNDFRSSVHDGSQCPRAEPSKARAAVMYFCGG